MPASDSAAEALPDPRVLGHLLLVQATVHALATREATAGFVAHGLRDLPGVADVDVVLGLPTGVLDEVAAASPPSVVHIPVDTVATRHGRIRLDLSRPDDFAPYLPYVHNLANVVGLILENREQADHLRTLNDELGDEVEERMAAEQLLVGAREHLEAIVSERTAALRHSEERLRLAQEAAGLGIWEYTERDTTLTLLDPPAALRRPADGCGVDEAVRISRLIHPDDHTSVTAKVQEALRAGSPIAIEFRVVDADGGVRWLSTRGRRIEDENGQTRLLGIVMDVTDRRALEDELALSRKLESLGRLAGGVAHDFNNILTAILGFASIADGPSDGDEKAEALAEIRAAALRGAAVTRQLLAFGRRQVSSPRIVQVNAVVSDVEGMLRRLIGEHVRLRIDLEASGASVRADAGQLGQVVVNLAVNARDAMPDGGVLTITTRVADARPQLREAWDVPDAQQYVVLTVADTGIGMTDEVRTRIFEPFFTTKSVGKGTGLGLASAYGFVRQSGGQISVESRAGSGSTFSVWLPRVAAAAPVQESVVPVTFDSRGRETILLVEDDDAIREIAVRVLERFGYRVVAAADPASALVTSRELPAIDLLVTDMVMPGGTGLELARALREGRAGLPVLITSGYSQEPVESTDDVDFLPKPFSPAELAAAARRILDAHGSPQP